MPMCAISPDDKRALAKQVGDDLLQHYGKKPYYTVDEVKASNKRTDVPLDVCCWSHAMFNTHSDFDAYHRSIGESCDYASMHSEMLGSISEAAPTTGFDIDFSWLELPDVDLSAIFDFIDL